MMNKMLAIVFVALSMSYVVHAEASLPTAIPGGKTSQQRVQLASDALTEYFTANPRGTEAEAAKAVGARMNKVFAGYVTNALPYSIDDCLLDARQRLDKAAKKAFPQYTDEEMQKKAEEKYPLYTIGERVKVLYKANPQYPSKVEGIFNGERNGYLRIGQVSVRRQDMEGITGNDEEILKFDQDATEILRKKFIREEYFKMLDGRKDFIAQNEENIIKETLKDYTQKNESNGFTFYDDTWYSPIDLLKVLSEKALEKYADALEAEKKAKNMELATATNAQAETLQLKDLAYPKKFRLDPTEVLKRQAENKLKQEALAEKEKEAEAERKQQAEEAEKQRKELQAAKQLQAKKQQNASIEEEMQPVTVFSVRNIIIIIAVLVVIAAGIVVFLIVKRKRDESKFTRYFEGKGEVQKKFWAKAEADPENFKYVAYMFPTENEAISALLELSYFSGTPDGNIKCHKNIDFGTYEHNGGFVAFIGGNDLHYAPWREATATLPEVPNAQYFKVSTEPAVLLELPTLDKHNVIELEREEVRSEDGSIILCYRYSADNKKDAMDFLNNLNLNEEGVMIQVETPEGNLCKDMEGIFEMEAPAEG